jgi:hypothetical protein
MVFPASFEYVPAHSLEEAGAALAEHGGDARVLADALSPLGVRHIEVPLTREKVWAAIREAENAGIPA